jgi:hypothetical protein
LTGFTGAFRASAADVAENKREDIFGKDVGTETLEVASEAVTF